MKSRKFPKKKVSQRPQIEIVERDPHGKVDLKDYQTKPSGYWKEASRRAKEL